MNEAVFECLFSKSAVRIGAHFTVQAQSALSEHVKVFRAQTLSCRDARKRQIKNCASCIHDAAGQTQDRDLPAVLFLFICQHEHRARQYRRVRDTFLLAIKLNLAISAVGFVLFQFFPQYIILLYGTGDALYFEFAIRFMRVFLFMVLLNGVQMLSSNFFTAIGKALKGLLLSLTRQVFFLIPLALILPLWLGISGIMLAGPIADFAAFLLSAFLVYRELKRQKGLSPAQP